MWPDITAIDLRSDEIIVVGHESGIIYTQSIKGDFKFTEMQIHNYHLSPVSQITLPFYNEPPDNGSGYSNNMFIAYSIRDHVLTLFSMTQDKPLRVMRFSQGFTTLFYLSKNNVIAFSPNNQVFSIDLNMA